MQIFCQKSSRFLLAGLPFGGNNAKRPPKRTTKKPFKPPKKGVKRHGQIVSKKTFVFWNSYVGESQCLTLK